VFGMVPALSATRTDLANDLKDRGGQPASTGRLWHPRSLLVSGQVAFSLVALIGAGLFIRSLRKAGEIDPGFDAPRLAAVSFNVGNQGYSEARGREYQRRALELAASTPGVVAAAVAKDVPLHVSAARTVLLDGQENTASGMGRFTLTEPVSPGYFRTMRIPLLAGRDFSPLDEPGAPRVAIVNEAAAAHFWPGQPAVGKRLHFYGDPLPAEVVGVARNANYQALGEQPQAFIYVSTLQYYFPTAVIYLNTAGDPEKVAASVRRAMQPLDRNLLLESESLGRSIRESLWAQRLSAGLLGVFGLLALLLATIGIYAVVSYSVNQRVREIGVRMALGATSGSVQRMVLREGLRVVAVGLAAGTLVALAVSRAVESMLFTIGGRDPVTFVLVPAVLALVALLACWIPARRTARFDPARSLRQE